MKQTFILLGVFFSLLIRTDAQDSNSRYNFNFLDSLINRKEFFAARNYYQLNRTKLTEFYQLKAGAALDNVFNKLDSSNQKIQLLFTKFKDTLTADDRFRLLKIKQMNHSKLFEYEKAFSDVNELLTNYASMMNNTELDDYRNTRTMWGALSGQPRQVVTVSANTSLPILHDKAGLQNLSASLGNVSVNFIFDTGANLSTVTESTAKQFQMRVLDSIIDVESITGLNVKSRIAVCPAFNLGHINIKNAVFLVFPDSALAVPQINYQIHGIIGFPVIEAMKEIQITRYGKFVVPVQKSKYDQKNMALDFLNPIIELDGESYTFDSGANSTLLYDHYYHKYKSRIDSLYQETTISIGGAGGSISRRGFIVRFRTTINNKLVILDSVQLFKEKIKDDNSFFGNIGQDLIKKFNRMTLNFQDMFIRFD